MQRVHIILLFIMGLDLGHPGDDFRVPHHEAGARPAGIEYFAKERHSFFNADKSGVVNCVSASAVAQPIESPIKRQQ